MLSNHFVKVSGFHIICWFQYITIAGAFKYVWCSPLYTWGRWIEPNLTNLLNMSFKRVGFPWIPTDIPTGSVGRSCWGLLVSGLPNSWQRGRRDQIFGTDRAAIGEAGCIQVGCEVLRIVVVFLWVEILKWWEIPKSSILIGFSVTNHPFWCWCSVLILLLCLYTIPETNSSHLKHWGERRWVSFGEGTYFQGAMLDSKEGRTNLICKGL